MALKWRSAGKIVLLKDHGHIDSLVDRDTDHYHG
jgi:hypothetical protein